MPVACQNEAQTADIERYPDDDQTSRDQQSSSWRLPGKRPPKQLVTVPSAPPPTSTARC